MRYPSSAIETFLLVTRDLSGKLFVILVDCGHDPEAVVNAVKSVKLIRCDHALTINADHLMVSLRWRPPCRIERIIRDGTGAGTGACTGVRDGAMGQVTIFSQDAEVHPNQLYRWRAALRMSGPKPDAGFAQVVMNVDGPVRDERPAIRVRVGRACVDIAEHAPAALVSVTLKALTR